MSASAAFALIRDGRPQYFAEQWIPYLVRDLPWGPDAFETWICQLPEIDFWPDEASTGAIVDFDQRTLVWCGELSCLEIPKTAALFDRLMATAWPGYEIIHAEEFDELTKRLDSQLSSDEDDEPASLGARLPTFREAAYGIWDADDSDEEDDDELDESEPRRITMRHRDVEAEDDSDDTDFEHAELLEFEDDTFRAWITVIDKQGNLFQRQIAELSEDLLSGSPEALDGIQDLPPCQIPPEHVVKEGMWFDFRNREIGLWSSPRHYAIFHVAEQSWSDWNVVWASRGYEQQCAAGGPIGRLMKTEEALGQFLPTILSTMKIDMQNVVGALGGSIKRLAGKATGCLLMVVCAPLLIFGLVSGNWTAVLITIAVVTALFIAAFKIVEYRVRKSFRKSFSDVIQPSEAPSTAGPLDLNERRKRLDGLLQEAGLPPLSRAEPYFVEFDWMNAN